MALAILRFLDSENGINRFQVELGINRFYRYAIGDQEVSRINGLVRLQDPIYTSPLIGPLPEDSLGRTILEVPQDSFDRQHRRIQITSFRTAKLVGPAISEIVTVLNVGSPMPNQNYQSNTNQELPALSFNLATETSSPMNKPLETVAFQYREVPLVSESMANVGALIGVFNAAAKNPTVRKVASSVAGAVLKKASDKLKGSSGKTSSTELDGEQIAQIAARVVEHLVKQGTLAPGKTDIAIAKNAMMLAQLASDSVPTSSQPVASSMALSVPNYASAYDYATLANQDYPDAHPALALESYYTSAYELSASPPLYRDAYSLSTLEDAEPDLYKVPLAASYGADYPSVHASSYADSMSSDSANSMSFNTLSGALVPVVPMLLPFTPQLISLVGSHPGKAAGAFLSKRRSTPTWGVSSMMGVDEDGGEVAQALLAALSLEIAASPTPEFSFRQVSSVKLEFSEMSPLMVQGKSQFLYRKDQDISFPIKLETPQPIRRARLQLLVKHPQTLQILIEQTYPVEQAASGGLSVIPKLSKEQLKTLAVNQEYLVCVALVWQGRSRKTKEVMQLGTKSMQLITLVNEYQFDRIEGTGATIPLNDVDKFRAYWHKVWQGDFSQGLLQINFECKYYYTLESNRNENARMETVTQVVDKDLSSQKSRLKSGLILSPYELNNLLGQLSAQPGATQPTTYPRLSDAELAALTTSEFQGRFHHAARTGVEFMGDPGQMVALWVYPEVKLQQVMLKKAENTNANGLVQALKDHPVYFPMPAVAHFIGASM